MAGQGLFATKTVRTFFGDVEQLPAVAMLCERIVRPPTCAPATRRHPEVPYPSVPQGSSTCGQTGAYRHAALYLRSQPATSTPMPWRGIRRGCTGPICFDRSVWLVLSV